RRGTSSSSSSWADQPCLVRGPVHAPGRASCPILSASLALDVDGGGVVATPPAFLGGGSKLYEGIGARPAASPGRSAGCLPPTLIQSANAGLPCWKSATARSRTLAGRSSRLALSVFITISATSAGRSGLSRVRCVGGPEQSA